MQWLNRILLKVSQDSDVILPMNVTPCSVNCLVFNFVSVFVTHKLYEVAVVFHLCLNCAFFIIKNGYLITTKAFSCKCRSPILNHSLHKECYLKSYPVI